MRPAAIRRKIISQNTNGKKEREALQKSEAKRWEIERLCREFEESGDTGPMPTQLIAEIKKLGGIKKRAGTGLRPTAVEQPEMIESEDEQGQAVTELEEEQLQVTEDQEQLKKDQEQLKKDQDEVKQGEALKMDQEQLKKDQDELKAAQEQLLKDQNPAVGEVPEGLPTEEWSVDALKAYAQMKNIHLAGKTSPKKILKMIRDALDIPS